MVMNSTSRDVDCSNAHMNPGSVGRVLFMVPVQVL